MSLSVTPMAGRTFGAVIDGVDLRDLAAAEWERIRDVWHESGIVVIPGQSLTTQDQVGFAQRVGDIERQTVDTMDPGLQGAPIVMEISNVDADGQHIKDRNHPQTRYLGGNEGWHSDSSFKPVTAKASVLFAIETPSSGGHTGYADARAGYDLLSDAEKERFAGLRAYHSLGYAQAVAKAVDADLPDDPTTVRGAWHDLVRTHPVTGRKSLFIGRHAALVEGMSVAESRAFLDELEERVCQGPRVYYHPWRPGDVVMWDNRCMLHRATEWDLNERRVLRHVRVAGDPEPAVAAG